MNNGNIWNKGCDRYRLTNRQIQQMIILKKTINGDLVQTTRV